MYHIGKVLKVFSPADADVESADKLVLAIVRMWDENVLTLQVAEGLEAKIKADDIVLADYRPTEHSPAPRQLITKILKGKRAAETLRLYEEHFAELKRRSGVPAQQQPQPYIR
jgi:hypothetical protein